MQFFLGNFCITSAIISSLHVIASDCLTLSIGCGILLVSCILRHHTGLDVTHISTEFAMVPKDLIMDVDLGDDRVLLFIVLWFTKIDEYTNIPDLIMRAGYQPTAGKKGKVRQFTSLLDSMVEKGYIGKDWNPVIPTRFAKVSRDEFNRIFWYREKTSCAGKTSPNKISHAKILILLSYIRSRMLRNQDGTPRYYSDHMNYLQDRAGFKSSIKKYADALVDLDVFRMGKMNSYHYKGEPWHSGSTVFVEAKRDDLVSYDPEQAIEDAKEDLMKQIRSKR